MGEIHIKEYYEMGNEKCVRNGYMVLLHAAKYYVRLAGFPLMVLLEFDNIEFANAWIDSQDNKDLAEKNMGIRKIRKFQKRFRLC